MGIQNYSMDHTFGTQPSNGNGQPTLYDLVGAIPNEELRKLADAHDASPNPDSPLAKLIAGRLSQFPNSRAAKWLLGAMQEAEDGSMVHGGASAQRVGDEIIVALARDVVMWVRAAAAERDELDRVA